MFLRTNINPSVIVFISGVVCFVSILPATDISQDNYSLENYSAATIQD